MFHDNTGNQFCWNEWNFDTGTIKCINNSDKQWSCQHHKVWCRQQSCWSLHMDKRGTRSRFCFVRIFKPRERWQVLWPDLKLCWYMPLITLLPFNISDKFYVKEVASLTAFKAILGNPEIETSRRLVFAAKQLFGQRSTVTEKVEKYHNISTDWRHSSAFPSFRCRNSSAGQTTSHNFSWTEWVRKT